MPATVLALLSKGVLPFVFFSLPPLSLPFSFLPGPLGELTLPDDRLPLKKGPYPLYQLFLWLYLAAAYCFLPLWKAAHKGALALAGIIHSYLSPFF